METSPIIPAIPLVVQLGFAGSRKLFDAAVQKVSDPQAFEDQVCEQLVVLISRLPAELGLSARHFFCGISQIAVGGDTVFTRACGVLNIPQRIILPQSLDEYLGASGSQDPDFSPSQQETTRVLLASPRIIQERVVSASAERAVRFSDTNLEIIRISDVIVGLVRSGQMDAPGGTWELIRMAEKRGKAVLVVTIAMKEGMPLLVPEWRQRKHFVAPALPHPLDHLPPLPAAGLLPEPPVQDHLPTAKAYADHLKTHASGLARSHKGLFKTAALIIIGTHILATVCAVVAVLMYDHFPHSLAWFLAPELLLIALGFTIHHRLHRREAIRRWAASRLLAELGRSVAALGNQYLYPEFLFQLPFPQRFRPLLRTLNVLHLASTARFPTDDWNSQRAAYLADRLDWQITFYARESARAAKWLRLSHAAFNVCSCGAFVAVVCKLLHWYGARGVVFLGPLPIVLPVLAVASLSLAAAFDWEARKHTFTDILVFLRSQRQLLAKAATEREFCQFLLETESRLLGETVNWYARRSFTGIS